MQKNSFDGADIFIKSIPKVMEAGKRYQWGCPVCGGTVKGSRNSHNNHLHVCCASCGLTVKQ